MHKLSKIALNLLFRLDDEVEMPLRRIVDLELEGALDELLEAGLAEKNPGRLGTVVGLAYGVDAWELA